MHVTTRTITLGGLLSALSLLFLLIGAISPTAELSLYALSSLPVAIAVIELGWRRAVLVYLGVSLIGLAWPGFAFTYLFSFFFGLFPILKAAFESRLNRPLAALAKQLTANFLVIAATWLFAREMILAQAGTWGWWYIPALVVALQVVIIVYDYALGLLITFYLDRLARHLRNKRNL
ncbi:MAG: hypothetical protein EOM08_05915 [Clostridia bacterium]|nr:hypothetical protein [Clostridia bacterium]